MSFGIGGYLLLIAVTKDVRLNINLINQKIAKAKRHQRQISKHVTDLVEIHSDSKELSH